VGQLKGISMRVVNKYEGTRLKKADKYAPVAGGEEEERGIFDKIRSIFKGKDSEEKDPKKKRRFRKTVEYKPPVEEEFDPYASILLDTAEVATEKGTGYPMDFVGPTVPTDYVEYDVADFINKRRVGDSYVSALRAGAMKESGMKRDREESGYYTSAKRAFDTHGRSLRDDFATGEYLPDGNAVFDTLAFEQSGLLKNPEGYFNKVYGDRGGNRGEESGDGYKYRGRGYFQLTGRDQYADVSKKIFGDKDVLLENPDLLYDPGVAEQAAAIYLNEGVRRSARDLNKKGLIDTRNLKKMSQADANLLVVTQIAGGSKNFSDTTEEGLRKMDAQTGVKRDYEALRRKIN